MQERVFVLKCVRKREHVYLSGSVGHLTVCGELNSVKVYDLRSSV